MHCMYNVVVVIVVAEIHFNSKFQFNMKQFGIQLRSLGFSVCHSRELEFDCFVGVSYLELISSLNVVLVHSAEAPACR